MKSILVISDLHCGSVVGITPPQYQAGETRGDQIALWEAATGMVDRFKERYGSPDVLIVNGDCLEGKCSRWGATDVITAKIRTQIDMAAEFINYIDAERIVMTRGTPYHVGSEEDWEDTLARDVGAEIKDHARIDIEGIHFSVKHRIGASTIPHGRHTAVARAALWDALWSIKKDQHPMADIIIRSHVHYATHCGDPTFLGITTPGLQGLGSKFGARMCEGIVDFGITYFFCEKGGYEWDWDVVIVEQQKDEIIKL